MLITMGFCFGLDVSIPELGQLPPLRLRDFLQCLIALCVALPSCRIISAGGRDRSIQDRFRLPIINPEMGGDYRCFGPV